MSKASYPKPTARRFRVYAFDPRASLAPETALINRAVISLPYEENYESPLGAGPTNEYIEVVDFDAPARLFYAPIDPNHPDLLPEYGLWPDEGSPQFHQQMAFAVAMKTIKGFENALGRKVLWASSLSSQRDAYIQRLRIYPHALAEPNAYYSPEKTALLFGYFRDSSDLGQGLPGGWVYTCLSHDIIAHETAHAILHGMHRRSIEPTGIDTLAFHEAFADIIALLQHFTMTDVVAHQIAASGGRLRMDSLLSDIAGQFGEATRIGKSLRSGLDRKVDPLTGRLAPPDPTLYAKTDEPHGRGAILVGALFDSFLTIFENRTRDLMRLATGNSVPTGAELPTELVHRLAREAGKAAEHLLRMCVRGLDLLPVTDLTFGEFLRAVITADMDLIPEDMACYRVILSDAFRRRGIFDRGWPSMAPESLRWDGPDHVFPEASFASLLSSLDLVPQFRREDIAKQERKNRRAVHKWLVIADEGNPDSAEDWERLLGVRFYRDAPYSIRRNDQGFPAIEVHSARIARRTGPNGRETRELFVEITQQRGGYFALADQKAAEKPKAKMGKPDFVMRGGSTLVIDLTDGSLRYTIRKRVDDDKRLEALRQWCLSIRDSNLAATYFGVDAAREPFALAHRS
ncbi:hypothetical protein ACFOKF_22565 [Sphingobium rhizovicinum]|uniref:Peptidase M4 n=1 Tax=Sphingobium rhizovicinum TaxID=432308 RepID=A0ABV7NP44_9SPHN